MKTRLILDRKMLGGIDKKTQRFGNIFYGEVKWDVLSKKREWSRINCVYPEIDTSEWTKI